MAADGESGAGGGVGHPQCPLTPDSPRSAVSDLAPASASASTSDQCSTRSLTQSILDYPTENGRRYHRYREGSYPFPNDDLELERLDLQYELLKQAMGGKEFFAPLNDPKKMLDIGTGTGLWPIEMADIFPNCEIIGTDLSAVQPDWVPHNVRFVIDDAAENDWLYPPDTFDYIHTRSMLGSFECFADIIKKAFKYTKPGGWVESQEFGSNPQCDDGTMTPDWAWAEWSRTLEEASLRFGRPWRIAGKLKRWYKEAGFVDVQEQVIKIPMNPWPKDPRMKDLGKMCELNLLDGVQGFSLALLHRALGWSKNEIEVYIVNARKAIRDRNVHAYYKAYVVWGRKPENASA